MSAAKSDLCLSADREAFIDDLQARYPTKRATVLHVLWEIQKQERWISQEWMHYAAQRCEVPPSHIMSVVSFYTMFHTKAPGKYHVEVCRNISCVIMDGRKIMSHLRDKLKLAPGEVSADGRFSYDEVECLAGCCGAPMMAINGGFHENLSVEKVDKILGGLS